MKPFSFSLEKVLNLRKFREDEAKIELGRATSELAGIEEEISIVGNKRAGAAAAQFTAGNSASEIQQYMLYIMRLDSAAENLLKEAAMAELKVEEARDVFLEASRERKVLDKLKEKRQNEYKKEALNRETKFLDDLSASAVSRGQVE